MLERIRTAVVTAPEEVVAVYLYGSYARGTATAASDVDLGLLLTAPPAPKLGNALRGVETALEERIGRQVEAVALNRAAPDLVHRVLRDGVILLDRDRSARISFEVQARNEYFDLAPLPQPLSSRSCVTDPELISKRLALIETCVAELRSLARPELIRQDVREERFIEHTLQIAIQAALDVASHVVSDERLGEPETNRGLFDLLARRDRIDEALAKNLRDLAGFRNVIVHGYQDVDLGVVEDVLANHLDDLLEFARLVREKLDER